MNTINKEELLKSSKWIRFLFMALYAVLINFIVLPFCIALSFIQFLFVLFASKPNKSIANINEEVIIEGEADIIQDESSEQPNN